MYTDFQNLVICCNTRRYTRLIFSTNYYNRLYSVGADKIRRFVGNTRVIRSMSAVYFSPYWENITKDR